MKSRLPALSLLLILSACGGNDTTTVSVTGQIEAVTIGVGSRVGGRVTEASAQEGDRVKQGQVLVRLDAVEAEAALKAAQAKLAQAQAALQKLENGARPEEIRQAEAATARAQEQYRMAVKGARSQEIKQAAANADAARAQRDETRVSFARIEKLTKSSAASQQQYDQAKNAFDAAEAQYKAAREREDLVMAGSRNEEIAMAKAAYDQAAAALDLIKNGARVEDLDMARAAKAAAQADVERAKVGLDEMVITSSLDAVVDSMDVHPGDIVKPGSLVTIGDPDDLKLYVYVSAEMLGYLRLDQKVPLTTDSYGPETFEGTIVYISPVGEFTPRNLQTKEERVQQVFGVKIRLNSAGGRLRAGMTATAHLTRQPNR